MRVRREQRNPPVRKRGAKRRWSIFALVFLLVGLSIILYPHVQKAIYQWRARKANAAFSERMEKYIEGQKNELYERMSEYNESLYQSGQLITDAFGAQTLDFDPRDYAFTEEIIGYLNIPKMDLELPIYMGATKKNLRLGAAHLSQTSLPVGGVNTNAVIAAHRGMSTADMFRYIDKLELGDPIYVINYQDTLRYKVAEIAIIRPDEIEKVLIQPGRDLITLITCHPYGHNYERYVVYAERVRE